MKENKKIQLNNSEFILVIFMSLLIGAGLTLATIRLSSKSTIDYVKVDSNIQTIIDTYNTIIDNYYLDVSETNIVNGAVKGMLDATGDPYSTYMDDQDYDNFNISLNGSYEGLGIEITKDGDNLVVVGIFADSPASESGLQLGDIIVAIDGQYSSNMSSQDFSQYVRNAKKVTFEILVRRENEEHTYTLKKRSIVIKSVVSSLIEEDGKKIGYIYLSIFANNSYPQFKEALEALEDENIESLIIDLRSNSGGELTVASNIISLFLDKSKIIYQTENRDGTRTKTYSTGAVTKKYPIVFLTNNGTASASEVMVAALRENLNSKVIGLNTFGKGTVQSLLTISTGDQYKITTKKWLTPQGTWIHGIGIKPDITVTLLEEYENQLEAAKDYLKGI